MRAKAARTATCALDVEVRWGDGELLASEHLRALSRYQLSVRVLPAGAAGFVVKRDWLEGAGDRAFTLAQLEVDHALITEVSGASRTLRLGEQTLVHVGPLVFRLALVEPRATATSVWTEALRPRDHAWTLVSFGLHALALSCMMLMPPRASSLSLDLMSEDTRYARYLTTPVAPEELELPWTRDGQDQAPASEESPRSAGDEGQAGKVDAPKSDRRMAVQGKSSERLLSNKPTAAEAREAGLLGALATASANLGPSSPYGPDTQVGYDAVSEIGKLFGANVGESEGLGGLGLRGSARGGGGDAEGTVGVGTLNTGEGARHALGATHGLLGRSREAHVPSLRSGTPEVRGSLSKEVIRRAIHLHLNEVRFCYERGLVGDPQLSGRVAVSFLIAPSGAVQQAGIKESTLGSKAVTDCIAQAVRRFTFPAPEGGGYVQVSYPFSFAAE
ncbi:MAG: putative abductin-like protein [Myxococcaceae bacterium]|nr:putative abductin-like protein [Myxococcaceae bacterium]